MSKPESRLHEEDGVREAARASQVPVSVVSDELLPRGLTGQNGKIIIEVHHIHHTVPSPEFRAKLTKGQRGSYGFELTVADGDMSRVLQQIDLFEEEMIKRFGDEEEKRAQKVRKDVVDLYGP
jgi:hypothetical protein